MFINTAEKIKNLELILRKERKFSEIKPWITKQNVPSQSPLPFQVTQVTYEIKC